MLCTFKNLPWLIGFWHLFPLYGPEQTHSNPVPCIFLSHLPPFWHGFGLQKLPANFEFWKWVYWMLQLDKISTLSIIGELGNFYITFWGRRSSTNVSPWLTAIRVIPWSIGINMNTIFSLVFSLKTYCTHIMFLLVLNTSKKN